MSGGHDHHPEPDSALALRARALEALLAEKGLIATDAIDAVVEWFERDVGPQHGARVVACAWTDPDFRERLLADATKAIAELGFGGFQGDNLVAVANSPTVHNVVVCTLCSCYLAGARPAAHLVQEPGLPGPRGGRAARRAGRVRRRACR